MLNHTSLQAEFHTLEFTSYLSKLFEFSFTGDESHNDCDNIQIGKYFDSEMKQAFTDDLGIQMISNDVRIAKYLPFAER